MTLRTHFLISEIAAERSGFSRCRRIIFCIGSLIPDLSPMQLIRSHFYAKSGKYVFERLEKLSRKNNTLRTVFEYGKLAHYVSDFCCSVHSGGSVGNIRRHVMYELRLGRYAVHEYESLRHEYISSSPELSLKKILSEYISAEKSDFRKDIISAIQACISVCAMAS
jgi:hypothetical protein